MIEQIPGFRGTFTPEQTKKLLQPIAPQRVFKANNQSHVPYFEVVAHLNRLFGFGNFSTEILDQHLIFETEHVSPRSKDQMVWDVCYAATMRLSIFDVSHQFVTSFENSSTGDALNQPKRSDAHDLALKSAISLATKRCAINLGDQFGLSLYNKGKQGAQVITTWVLPKGFDDEVVEPELEQVTSEGIDETTPPATEATDEQMANLAESLGATEVKS
jgi:recombination DNA repair RAD52 pathway protein